MTQHGRRRAWDISGQLCNCKLAKTLVPSVQHRSPSPRVHVCLPLGGQHPIRMTATTPRSSSADWPTLSLSKETTRRRRCIVDADPGKGPLAQAPLIYHWWQVPALCHRARPHHFPDALWRSFLPDRSRLQRPSAPDRDEPGRLPRTISSMSTDEQGEL
jgi:hypothetical protein